jgi:hypothetical protein
VISSMLIRIFQIIARSLLLFKIFPTLNNKIKNVFFFRVQQILVCFGIYFILIIINIIVSYIECMSLMFVCFIPLEMIGKTINA